MGQFQPGIPYTAGHGAMSAGGSEQQQPLQRLVQQAKAFTRYDGALGQATLFGPLNPGNLLYARVSGVLASEAFLYIGQGDLAAVIQPSNFESATVNGSQDEASWARPGLPIFDQWAIAVFWNRNTLWGQGTAKIYHQPVAI